MLLSEQAAKHAQEFRHKVEGVVGSVAAASGRRNIKQDLSKIVVEKKKAQMESVRDKALAAVAKKRRVSL